MVSKSGSSSRKLLYLVVLVVAVVGAFFYLRGKQHSAAAVRATPTPHVKRGKKPPTATPYIPPIRAYARKIIPVLDRSTAVFDRAAGRASRAGLTKLGGICSFYAPKVNLLTSQVDGIPHPYAWYTAVGSLHHAVLGTYHYMQGALDECRTAAGNQDQQGALQAIADMGTAARRLHKQDSRTHAQAAGKR